MVVWSGQYFLIFIRLVSGKFRNPHTYLCGLKGAKYKKTVSISQFPDNFWFQEAKHFTEMSQHLDSAGFSKLLGFLSTLNCLLFFCVSMSRVCTLSNAGSSVCNLHDPLNHFLEGGEKFYRTLHWC